MPDTLIPLKEALRRLGYKHRNSLPTLQKMGLTVIKRQGRNYFLASDVERVIRGAPVIYSQPSAEASDPEYMRRITQGD